jgi:oligopeptide transport system ATP-binding protein
VPSRSTAEPQACGPQDPDVLRVDGLTKSFPTKAGRLVAVDDISFAIGRGETLGIVGESGCGKTTLARLLLRLEQPDAGSALLGGEDFFAMSGNRLRRARRRIQMVFQDPYSSLNPHMTVEAIISEPWLNYPDVVPHRDRAEEVVSLLDKVGMGPRAAHRRPHELSGGQLQRVGIARALALRPELLVLDEPVASLDLSVQAQVLNLLANLQDELGISYLFVAHDLSVVRHVAHRIGVIYLGRIVEIGTSEQIFDCPEHPYTRGLIAASPVLDLNRREPRTHALLQGDPPSPVSRPSGCPFRTRCELAQPRCAEERPELEERRDRAGHRTACHFVPGVSPAEFPVSVMHLVKD